MAKSVVPAGVTPLRAGTVSRVLFADISEFQPDIADAAYVQNFSHSLVIRAAYGEYHDDHAWYGGARRTSFWNAAGDTGWLGIYQYLVASQDPAAQARELIRLVGSVEWGETLICDIEEGSGSQGSRYSAWRNAILDAFPYLAKRPLPTVLYSGLYFSETHGLSPQWVAAYQSAEPTVPHRFWQFTDRYSVPGVGSCDCSVFHGTQAQIRALAVPQASPTDNWTATMIDNLPTLQQGDQDVQGSGRKVVRLQGLLTALGDPVTLDGDFGPATTGAVKSQQQAFGLTADGVVGRLTWQSLITGQHD
jgi:GH25 family lysozyme M1 (1,4-beta-N-acetylmuramidase)